MQRVSFALSACAVATTASICTVHTSSATLPTPDIALSNTCSASCAHHCTTKTPSGKRDCRVKVEFGATRDFVAELPKATTLRQTEDVVSTVVAPVACCELACYEPCERFSEGEDGEDIVSFFKQLQKSGHSQKDCLAQRRSSTPAAQQSSCLKIFLRPLSPLFPYFTKELTNQIISLSTELLSPASLGSNEIALYPSLHRIVFQNFT